MKRTWHQVDFVVPADHFVKTTESEKNKQKSGSCEKTWEYWGDGGNSLLGFMAYQPLMGYFIPSPVYEYISIISA